MTHYRYFLYHTKGQSLCYSDTNSGWWATPPSLLNLRSKWPTPFEKRRLPPISAHSVSTVGDSEKSSIMTNIKSTMGFPTSHRWSEYVTPKCHKGWSKNDFFCLFETADRLKRCQLSSPVSVINFWWSAAMLFTHHRGDLYSAARPSRRNYLITIWCGSVSSCGNTYGNWESSRDWLSVPPFTRAFLKSPSSRGLSATAQLLVHIILMRDLEVFRLVCVSCLTDFIKICQN